jgi:hypothetical protein
MAIVGQDTQEGLCAFGDTIPTPCGICPTAWKLKSGNPRPWTDYARESGGIRLSITGYLLMASIRDGDLFQARKRHAQPAA